jgi:hypothetical protein
MPEPDLYWLPLSDEQRTAVAHGELVRIDVPDAETGEIVAQIMIPPRNAPVIRRGRPKRSETP